MTIPAGYGQFSVEFSLASGSTGTRPTITLGFEHAGTGKSINQCANDFITAWSATLQDRCYTGWADGVLRTKWGPDATGPSDERAIPLNGSYSGAPSSPQVAVLVKKNTPTGGRRGRGRLYWPHIPEADVGPGGALASGVQALFTSDFEAFREAMELSGLFLHLLHQPGDSVVPEPTLITSFSAMPVVATQRRRVRR